MLPTMKPLQAQKKTMEMPRAMTPRTKIPLQKWVFLLELPPFVAFHHMLKGAPAQYIYCNLLYIKQCVRRLGAGT